MKAEEEDEVDKEKEARVDCPYPYLDWDQAMGGYEGEFV